MDIILFVIFIGLVIIQRIAELWLANRNEKWMKAQGAIEYGKEHYKYMVLLHLSFFLSLISEVTLLHKTLSNQWGLLFLIFVLIQFGRVSVIMSLGKYWNTKIIVLPGIQVISKGLFKYVKHPNYLIVTIELIVIPLLFNAYITAILFFILNQVVLSIRIPIEEKALRENTNYTEHFD